MTGAGWADKTFGVCGITGRTLLFSFTISDTPAESVEVVLAVPTDAMLFWGALQLGDSSVFWELPLVGWDSPRARALVRLFLVVGTGLVGLRAARTCLATFFVTLGAVKRDSVVGALDGRVRPLEVQMGQKKSPSGTDGSGGVRQKVWYPLLQ